MKLATAFALVGSAAAAYRTAPLGSHSGDANWKLDKGRSDEFGNINGFKWMTGFYEPDACTKFKHDNGSCDATWYGQAPTLIRSSAVSASGGAVSINIGPSSNTDDFDEANTANAATDADCNCQYEGYETGLIKSRKLNRGGIYEIAMQTPDNDKLVASVWLQSDNLEVSALSIKGDSVTTSGFVFAGDDTTSTASVGPTALGVDASSGFFVYGIEWKLGSNDIVISVDGNVIHTLAGSAWNPTDANNGQELNIIVDLQVDEAETASDALASTHTLKLDQMHVWEYDCAVNFKFGNTKPAKGQGTARGLTGMDDADYSTYLASNDGQDPCKEGAFADHCDEPRKGMCMNPYSGSAPVTNPADVGPNPCTLINQIAFCGGGLDNKGTHRGNDGKFASGEWNGNAGSMGLCKWDKTAKRDKSDAQKAAFELTGATKEGSCVPTLPTTVNLGAYNAFSKVQQCGGTNDKTGGKGMYCFGKCVPRTEFNTGNTWFQNFCGGVVNDAGEDVCETFGKSGVHKTAEYCEEFCKTWTGSGECKCKAGTWASDYKECMRTFDNSAANMRSKHCYMTYRTGAEAKQIGEWTKERPGMYCMSRVPGRQGAAKGGLPLWMLGNFGQDKCEDATGVWACMANKPSDGKCKLKNKCKPASADRSKFVDLALCASKDESAASVANCDRYTTDPAAPIV